MTGALVPPPAWTALPDLVTLPAVLAAAAVALLWPARPVTVSRSRAAPAVVALLAGVAGLLMPAPWLLPAVVLAPVVITLVLLRRVAARRRHGVREAERALAVCEDIAGELSAGADPGVALQRAATRWPELAGVASSQRLGGRVPPALRALATQPGWVDLTTLAAAWEVAERTGAGLVPALAATGERLRDQARTRRLVASELASARATARLVAGLPVLTLAAGSGAGSPVGFLLGTPAGLACLAAGLAFALTGLAWIEAIAGAVERVL